jgi:hypothetical protein
MFSMSGRLLVQQSLALFAICIIQAREERAEQIFARRNEFYGVLLSRSEQCKFIIIICWFLIALSEGFAFDPAAGLIPFPRKT